MTFQLVIVEGLIFRVCLFTQAVKTGNLQDRKCFRRSLKSAEFWSCANLELVYGCENGTQCEVCHQPTAIIVDCLVWT